MVLRFEPDKTATERRFPPKPTTPTSGIRIPCKKEFSKIFSNMFPEQIQSIKSLEEIHLICHEDCSHLLMLLAIIRYSWNTSHCLIPIKIFSDYICTQKNCYMIIISWEDHFNLPRKLLQYLNVVGHHPIFMEHFTF